MMNQISRWIPCSWTTFPARAEWSEWRGLTSLINRWCTLGILVPIRLCYQVDAKKSVDGFGQSKAARLTQPNESIIQPIKLCYLSKYCIRSQSLLVPWNVDRIVVGYSHVAGQCFHPNVCIRTASAEGLWVSRVMVLTWQDLYLGLIKCLMYTDKIVRVHGITEVHDVDLVRMRRALGELCLICNQLRKTSWRCVLRAAPSTSNFCNNPIGQTNI